MLVFQTLNTYVLQKLKLKLCGTRTGIDTEVKSNAKSRNKSKYIGDLVYGIDQWGVKKGNYKISPAGKKDSHVEKRNTCRPLTHTLQ